MPTTFNPKITSAGLNAAIAANGSGLSLQLTHIALGSGKYNPTGAETALVNRIETATIAPGSSAGAATLSVLAVFAGYAGGDYDLGEVGLFAGNPAAGGVLFAVASRAGLRYSIRSAAVEAYTTQFTLALSGAPSGSVNVTVDAAGNVAASLVANHIAAVNPHPQYVRKAGDTMTGPLTLAGNAVLALQPVTLQQMAAAAYIPTFALSTPNASVSRGDSVGSITFIIGNALVFGTFSIALLSGSIPGMTLHMNGMSILFTGDTDPGTYSAVYRITNTTLAQYADIAISYYKGPPLGA